MPLHGMGLTHYERYIGRHLEDQIAHVLSMIDDKIKEISHSRGLFPTQVKLLQPLHCCAIVTDVDVFVVLAVHELGAMSVVYFTDWPGTQLEMTTAITLAERDLSFRNAFGFQFSRSVLDLGTDDKEVAISQIAEQYIEDEIENSERQRKIVRMTPIFQGREFLLDTHLVFTLSPFGEPYDTIYRDHIKPSVESVVGLRCLRADDIYDNRPIIEDIWQFTNESRMLVAELTGRNANVFYETGIAHTIGKEVILITQSMDDVPFDLRHLRCIVYEYTPRGINTLEDNLKNTILNVLTRPS